MVGKGKDLLLTKKNTTKGRSGSPLVRCVLRNTSICGNQHKNPWNASHIMQGKLGNDLTIRWNSRSVELLTDDHHAY